jgi:uncharacterized repeat protein (TIGR03803 family)
MRATKSTLLPILRNAATLVIGLALFLATAQAQTYSVLHNFTGGIDGATPVAGLTMDAGGHLYGTAFTGGAGSSGTVFKLSNKSGSWLFSPLYSFTGAPDGAGPYAGVTIAKDGTLYGTTSEGGTGQCNFHNTYFGCGTVFHLRPSVAACRTALCLWKADVIHNFTGGADGAFPELGNLIFDQAGNIYGTTALGGLYGGCYYYESNCGVVFELSPSGGGWVETELWEFGIGNDGQQPSSGVIFDQAGNLYGTTQRGGGGADYGTIFQLTPSGPPWNENIIHYFDGTDGATPIAGLIIDGSGNLFGDTASGGSGGGGTVFEVMPSGSGWDFNSLYSFTGSGGSGPWNNLVMDKARNLYGTTSAEGAYGYGAVFELVNAGGGNWTYKSLYDFCAGGLPCVDGATPYSSLVFDASGNLYGTASAGGADGKGVVFEITP